MATPHGDPLQEMEALLAAMSEAALDDEGRRRLAQLVRQEPEARRLYLDYCQMHAMLRSAHGVLCALELPRANRRRRTVWIAAGLLALGASLLIAWVAFYHRAARLSAAVVAIQGDVRVSGDDTPKPVTVGTNIAPGQRIQTGSNGTADLRLADGTNIRVANSTDASFAAQQNVQRVDLRAGSLECDVTRQPKGKSLVFNTSHAEVTVLGTAFELSAGPVETRARVMRGRVRLAAAGKSVDAGQGELATADDQGIRGWTAVCNLDFRAMKDLPPQLDTLFCGTTSLHSAQRNIVPGRQVVRLESGGLRFVNPRPVFGDHGLIVSRWTEQVGSDVAVEVDVSAGEKWSLGIAVDGDSFQGYRIIFAVPHYPNGIAIDSIYPAEQTLLAQDPRPISYERDHLLRVEKQGRRIRVWVDRELRIDTEVAYPLAKDRKKTFAISNFGESPLIRALRVWKATPTTGLLE